MSEKLFFKHDFYALEDRPLRKLVADHSAYGYAIFFVALEFFYKDDGQEISIDDLAWDVSDKLHINDEETTKEVLQDCVKYGLFKQEGNMIYSERVKEACQDLNNYIAERKACGLKGGAPKGNKNAVKKQPTGYSENNLEVDSKTTNKRREDEEKNKCREEKKEYTRKNSAHEILNEMAAKWNEICTACPKAVKLTIMDEMNLKLILQDWGTPDITEQMQRIQESDFATGNSERGWKMTFSKFLADFTDVVNGKYDGKKKDGKFKPKDLSTNHRDAEVQTVEEF